MCSAAEVILINVRAAIASAADDSPAEALRRVGAALIEIGDAIDGLRQDEAAAALEAAEHYLHSRN